MLYTVQRLINIFGDDDNMTWFTVSPGVAITQVILELIFCVSVFLAVYYAQPKRSKSVSTSEASLEGKDQSVQAEGGEDEDYRRQASAL